MTDERNRFDPGSLRTRKEECFMAKGVVKFNEERCKGCELCISVCPVKILTLHETKINSKGYRPAWVKDAGRCIGCGSCALMCPDGAISVYLEEKGESKNE